MLITDLEQEVDPMNLVSIRVKSYKSFVDSGEMLFSNRNNVIVGVNNSGKTALLEALTLNTWCQL
jgi:AAA15 family ATPase/GTPase